MYSLNDFEEQIYETVNLLKDTEMELILCYRKNAFIIKILCVSLYFSY